jgi:hypothetical protein
MRNKQIMKDRNMKQIMLRGRESGRGRVNEECKGG